MSLPWARAASSDVGAARQEILLRWFGADPSFPLSLYRVIVMAIGVASLVLILLPPRRVAYLLGFLVCAALMGWALWLQYGQGLEPCPLCVFQRVAVCAIGIVFLVALDPQPGRVGAAVYAVLAADRRGIGAAFAARQVWLQALPEGPGAGVRHGPLVHAGDAAVHRRHHQVFAGQRRMRGERLGVPGPGDCRLDARVLHRRHDLRVRARPSRLDRLPCGSGFSLTADLAQG